MCSEETSTNSFSTLHDFRVYCNINVATNFPKLGIFRNWGFSKIRNVSKLGIFQNYEFFEIRVFPKLEIFRN